MKRFGLTKRVKRIIICLLLLSGFVINATPAFAFTSLEDVLDPSLVVSDISLDTGHSLDFNGTLFANNPFWEEAEAPQEKAKPTQVAIATPIEPKPVFRQKPSPDEISAIFDRYSGEYGIPKEWLEVISYCESTYNPSATSSIYVGLFQFAPATWISNRNAMGLDPNPDLRTNPEEATRTAAFKMSRDGTGAWPTCRKRLALAN